MTIKERINLHYGKKFVKQFCAFMSLKNELSINGEYPEALECLKKIWCTFLEDENSMKSVGKVVYKKVWGEYKTMYCKALFKSITESES